MTLLIHLVSGAVKANIGHLRGASGVAGLIKTILVLEKGVIPPNINFELLSPKIDSDLMKIKVPFFHLIISCANDYISFL